MLTRRKFLGAAGAGAATLALGPRLAGATSSDGQSDSEPVVPDPAGCPIDHVVVLMMENRSFDHYLGTMAGVDGLTLFESNPDRDGNPVTVFELDRDVVADPDPDHSWTGGRRQLNAGAMDGFVVTTGTPEPMGYYTERTIPWLRAFAAASTTCDRWFCSHLGSTWPNRNYLHAAQDFGYTSNDSGDGYPAALSIYDRLDAASVSWKYYFIDLPFLATYDRFPDWVAQGHIGTAGDYMAEAIAGTLPQVAMVDPAFFVNDDHPPADIQAGQRYMSDCVAALTAGPLWRSTALFLTYDEWGGFYDHVVPPRFPDLRPSDDVQADHSQAGFRVPTVIGGAWARAGHVDSTPMEHTSITKFIEWRFGIEPLTRRDEAAHNPVLTAFDFTGDPRPVPELPEPSYDPLATATSAAGAVRGRAGLAGFVNPVPELTAVALARAPRAMLQVPTAARPWIDVPVLDRATNQIRQVAIPVR